MASHTSHPDVHEHGLQDECPRCEEIAADPFTRCDDDLLRSLYRRTLDWMDDDAYPRSAHELCAMQLMESVIVRARRLELVSTSERVA